jgi:hypothetical protein
MIIRKGDQNLLQVGLEPVKIRIDEMELRSVLPVCVPMGRALAKATSPYLAEKIVCFYSTVVLI